MRTAKSADPRRTHLSLPLLRLERGDWFHAFSQNSFAIRATRQCFLGRDHCRREPRGNTPAASPAIDTPLIAHWTFDEASGDECADSGGHG